jgi:hypothetical protein
MMRVAKAIGDEMGSDRQVRVGNPFDNQAP